MKKLDQFRTRYKGLPKRARHIIGAIARFVPSKFKYGRRYKDCLADITRARHDPEFAKEKQIDLLAMQLKRASLQSIYFREAFVRAQLDLSGDISDQIREAFGRLSIMEKDSVSANWRALHPQSVADFDLVTTSGSSGQPLKFLLDRERSVIEWAFLNDAWSQIGYTAGAKRALLRGFEIENVDKQPWEYDAGLRELRLSSFHLSKHWLPTYVKQIQKKKISFLHGYPSALEILARHLVQQGRSELANTTKGIILTSEAHYPHQISLYRTAFPKAKIVSFYGLSEKVLFAVSDPTDPFLFWFNPIYGIAELINTDGSPITKIGDRGALVGTGLQFRGTPFIRYDTGDVAELAVLPSVSNGFRLGVRNITPRRSTEYLVGRDGSLISMSALNIHSAAYTTMEIFVIEQDTPGHAVVKAVVAAGRTEDEVSAFIDEIGRKTGKNLIFTIEIVSDIPPGPRGKRSWVQQSLDVAAIMEAVGL